MNLFDRLFSRTIIRDNGCWEYTGRREEKGYARMRCGGGARAFVHRLAYDLVVDDIPDGMKVLHKCDNPICVNPEHLFLGTNQDNTDDMLAKGRERFLKGDELPQAKLNKEQVREIKRQIAANLLEGNELASKFGVSPQTICDIKAGRTWKHVGGH
jgi:hypothetical protein